MMHPKAGRSARLSRSRPAATGPALPHRRREPTMAPSASSGYSHPAGSPERGYRDGFDQGFKLGFADGYEAGLAEIDPDF